MSIAAFTKGTQKCQVIIPWVRMSYVLETSGRDVCSIEFIAKVEKGKLNFLDLYIPYEIFTVENLTECFLDEEKNGIHFDLYEVISHDKTDPRWGEVRLNDLMVRIREVHLTSIPTERGAKITIQFPESVMSGELRAVRLLFDYKSLSKERNVGQYDIGLRYYGRNDAFILKLKSDEVVSVEKLKVWMALPYGIIKDKTTPPAHVSRTWDGEDFDSKYLEVFFGSMTENLFSKLPIISREWFIADKKPALTSNLWSTTHLNCEYTVQNPKLGKERIKYTQRKEGTPEYILYLSNSSGIGIDQQSELTRKIIEEYLENKKTYGIFIYQMNVVKKIKTRKEVRIESIELDQTVLNLLVLFLKYKDKRLLYLKLYHKAWEGSAHHNYKIVDSDEIIDNLKGAVSSLRAKFMDVEGFCIPKARGGGYVCKGNFKFCLILDKSNDEMYTLEGV